MDLKGMLNDGAGSAAQASAPTNPPPHPRPSSQHQHQQPQSLPSHHHHQQHTLPSTPTQSGPAPFEYPKAVRASPARTMSRDYHPAQQTPFGSPPAPHGVGTPYSRPPPVPLHYLAGPLDPHSTIPGAVVDQASYGGRTPGIPMRSESAGYPFPHPQHPQSGIPSPVQQPNRYPPSGAYPPRDSRESYSQPSGPMASPSATRRDPAGWYRPPSAAVSATQSVEISGGAHPQHIAQQHNRSSSTQGYHRFPAAVGSPVGLHQSLPPEHIAQQHNRSSSTQGYHGFPAAAGSPVGSHQSLPSEHMRPPSQPATPHGPPLSAGSRQSVGAGAFAQPPSPYQQRAPPPGAPYAYPSQHPQQHRQHSQPPQQPSPQVAPRPQPSPQAPVQRPSSAYDQPPVYPQAVEPHRASLSHSDRERSLSVSPKTRVPSLPSSAGHHSQASLSGPSGPPADLEPRQIPSNSVPTRDGPVNLEREAPPLTGLRAERASTPAKRKMDDRDDKEEDIEQQEPRPPPFANGSDQTGSSTRPAAAHHPDTPMPARRKPRHSQPPIWAVPYDRQPLKNGNFHLRKPHVNHPHSNGRINPTSSAPRPERPNSRHVSPEASRTNVPGTVANQPSPAPALPIKATMLGPWEPTIANLTPIDEMATSVADFLFVNVVQASELTKLHGQKGIHFEIEAKLGYLAGQGGERFRFQPPLTSEAVLDPRANYTPSFVSDMDESKHRFFNDHLNALVKQSSPQNPNNKNSSDPRVPINYVHTKEIDRFLDLKDPRAALPPILLRVIDESRGRMPSIRITRDKNNRIIAKIIKVKIGDLHIHMPKAMLDCRVTVNVEVDYHGVLEGLDDGVGQPDRTDRHKDRLSYRQGVYQIDLTQVSQPEAGPSPQHKKHELEIELNTDAVIEHGRRAEQGAPNDYQFLVEGFVNNIRYLARKITTMGPQ